MSVTVIIPFYPESPERIEALTFVRAMWEEDGFEVIVSHSNETPWCKARVIQAGVDACDSDILIIADADCWCAINHIRAAISHADSVWANWALPHRRVMRFDKAATTSIYNGDEFEPTYEEPPYTALSAAGGIVCLTRELWNRVPMDPRFLGWGFEDVAWFCALRTLDAPAWRGKADLWHLWHPRIGLPPNRVDRDETVNQAAHDLLRRYQQARYRPAPMAGLISEAKMAFSEGDRSVLA